MTTRTVRAAWIVAVSGVLLVSCANGTSVPPVAGSSSGTDTSGYPPIDVVVRTMQLDGPAESINGALGDAQAVVVAQVVSIEDPRWNSEDGSDWRARAAAHTQGSTFTIPIPYTKVNIHVTDVLTTGDDPSVSQGDDLGVDFVLDPSLDVLQPIDTASGTSSSPPDVGANPGVAAGFLAPGDERIFLLQWRRFPLEDGWSDYGWHADVQSSLWGIDGSTVFPAGRSQAEELARSHVHSVNVVDWATTTIAMDDFMKLIDDARAS